MSKNTFSNNSYNSNPNLKPVGIQWQWTKDEILEFNKCKNDPVYFIEKYIKINHVTHGKINVILNVEQKRIITNIDSGNTAWNEFFSLRQIGKTTAVLAYLCWFSRFHNNIDIDIRSIKTSTSKELMQSLLEMIKSLPPEFQIKSNYPMVNYNNNIKYK